MAYIGLQPQQKTVATSTQTLTGNGVDFEFILNRAVSKAADILVFVGNTAQVPEVDYTAENNRIIFSAGKRPANAAPISVNYKAGALTTVYVSANSYPVGTTVNPSIRSVDAPSTGIYFPSTTSVGVTVAGNTRVKVTDDPIAINTSTGALQVTGGVGVTQNMFIGGHVDIADSAESVDSAVGALVVSGGVGIGKNLNVAGDLSVAGDFTVAGTFTTTGADSLAVNDPFIFLANANPGDNLDTGVISSYNDGTAQRYTGIFRDVTDNHYKLFYNLLTQPTTTVNTADSSFKFADLVVGNLVATNLTGTLLSGENITSLGNLTALNVAGVTNMYDVTRIYSSIASTSTTTGALQVSGGVGVVGNINAGNITASIGSLSSMSATGNVSAANLVSSFGLWGTVRTAAQPNITSVGTLASLSVTGNVSAANVVSSFGLWGTLRTAAQPNITSVGTLTDLSVSGGVTVNSSNNLLAIANAGTAGVGNIGASGQGFNTVFAKSTSAQYADVAERYLTDSDYEPGTVLHFGGEYEVTQCNEDHCTRIAGVVSTNPAVTMNDSLQGTYVIDLALLGRVPTKVVGSVTKGDMMVSAGNGRARSEANPKLGAVIGKALQDFDGTEGTIEIVVGRI